MLRNDVTTNALNSKTRQPTDDRRAKPPKTAQPRHLPRSAAQHARSREGVVSPGSGFMQTQPTPPKHAFSSAQAIRLPRRRLSTLSRANASWATTRHPFPLLLPREQRTSCTSWSTTSGFAQLRGPCATGSLHSSGVTSSCRGDRPFTGKELATVSVES